MVNPLFVVFWDQIEKQINVCIMKVQKNLRKVIQSGKYGSKGV